MQLRNRQNIRLKDYDYSSEGGYFITILTKNKEGFFTDFYDLYNIVKTEWLNLSERFENIKLDEFIIMPNHIHGVIFIGSENFENGVVSEKVFGVSEENFGARGDMKPPHTPPQKTDPTKSSPTKVQTTSKNQPKLGDIVCAFKSRCVHEWLKHIKANNIDFNGKIWHRNYYEKIIRDEKHLNNVRQYIRDNPIKWELDLARGENTDTSSMLARGDIKPHHTCL